jgi:hypothetical protein
MEVRVLHSELTILNNILEESDPDGTRMPTYKSEVG